MKIVKEHINEKFSTYGDPIKDMDIGFTQQQVINMIIKEDKKYNLILFNHGNIIKDFGNIRMFEVTGAVGRNQQYRTGTYFKIILWTDDYYFPPDKNGGRKRMTFRQKAEYLNRIIEDADLADLFDGYNFNPKTKYVVNFRINPNSKTIFKPGKYLHPSVTQI